MKIKDILTLGILIFTSLISVNCFAVNSNIASPSTNPTSPTTTFNQGQVQQIQQVIHDYLLQNPQLMVEVFQKLQAMQQTQMEQQALKAIKSNQAAIFNDPNSPVVGNPKGTVTLVEFFDYQCPHCKAMTPIVDSLIQQDKSLRVVMKEFPIFPGSNYAAEAALAAQMQGKYWEFHSALMADQNPLNKADVLNAANKVGLNIDQLQKDMASDTIKNELQQTENLADKLGLAGTPAFIVQSNTDNNKTYLVPGQIDKTSLQNLINKAAPNTVTNTATN